MSINIPIVATAVGDTAKILKAYKGSLCKPDDPLDMKEKICSQINKKSIDYRKIALNYTWDILSRKLD